MGQLTIYVGLFSIIVFAAQIFSNSKVPVSLILVLIGMVLCLLPGFPQLTLNPKLVLNGFLPILLYQMSSFASWKDVKKNLRPIALLSVGHVIFITILVAIVIYNFIPELGWPLAFVLGAVISPPDDVAIVSIAEKIRMPERVVTILEGEGMLNDVTALILFRFALAAAIIHEFSMIHAVTTFFVIIIAELLYGFLLGHLLGQLRMRIRDPILMIVASILTPFLAYLPPEKLGGSGIVATVVTGFVIGHIYSVKFSYEFRLISRAVWPTIVFLIQSILFLLIGLNLSTILKNISSIPINSLLLYSSTVIATVIIGRFIWVFGALIYLPRLLFPSILKNDPYPPWQFPFVISWAGMRGSISLAAALAVPILPVLVDGANTRDLLIFLVFCVIAATLLIQGLSLPWILKLIGINKYGRNEECNEKLAELNANLKMNRAVIRWLKEFKKEIANNSKLVDIITLQIQTYIMRAKAIKAKLSNDNTSSTIKDLDNDIDEVFILMQIIEIERSELLALWRNDKVNQKVRNKLLDQLDHRAKNLSSKTEVLLEKLPKKL